jgi:PAS domain S-box-containing protein
MNYLKSIITSFYKALFSSELNEADKFIDKAAIISITDERGKIIYVNDKFEKVSGWTLDEVRGKDHSIVNSGTQPDGYWGNMYETVLKGEVWNDIVCNVTKEGEYYWVDTYIRARFDKCGKLKGFSSIRQDVTDLKKKELDIRNRMNAINQSNSVIEFNTSGNVIYANQNFCNSFATLCTTLHNTKTVYNTSHTFRKPHNT